MYVVTHKHTQRYELPGFSSQEAPAGFTILPPTPAVSTSFMEIYLLLISPSLPSLPPIRLSPRLHAAAKASEFRTAKRS